MLPNAVNTGIGQHTKSKTEGASPMEVLKHGNIYQNKKRFLCTACWCEFRADASEYYDAQRVDGGHVSHYFACICPECGHEAGSLTKERSDNMPQELISKADSLSLFLRNRADAGGKLNDYDTEMLLDASQTIDELTGVVQNLSEEYLQVCENECTGDGSVGIAACPFYQWPDADDNGKLIPGGCKLRPYTKA